MALVGILEDNVEIRQVGMRAAVADLNVELVIHDEAPGFIEWLKTAYAKIDLLSLDHDLGPSRDGVDPGTGKDVVNYLLEHEPRFPVIVHSSNPYDAPVMETLLQTSGWNVVRVPPFGDNWIEVMWRNRVKELLT